MRIPKEEFEKWYGQQDVYKKADKMPTISDMEKDYIRFEEAAIRHWKYGNAISYSQYLSLIFGVL